MTKVTCEPCKKQIQMMNAEWVLIDENKPAYKENLMWCCTRCLKKIDSKRDKA